MDVQAQVQQAIEQAKEVQMLGGISLFDVLLVLFVFLIINKVLGGQLIAAIKSKLGGAAAPAAPATSVAPTASTPASRPGVEAVHSTLVASGVPAVEADTFVKAHWEQIRGGAVSATPVAAVTPIAPTA